jgi:hypothetical protein
MPVIQPFTFLKYSLNEQAVLREGIGIIKKKKKKKKKKKGKKHIKIK